MQGSTLQIEREGVEGKGKGVLEAVWVLDDAYIHAQLYL